MKFLKGARLQHSLRFTSLIAVFVAFSLFLAFPTQDSSIEADEALASYIVKAGSLEQALGVATDVGGNITHELSIINAVGADLSASQVQVLRGMEGVKVLVNGRVSVTSDSQTFVYDDNAYPIEHFESQGAPGDACLSHPEYERTFDVSDNFIIDDLNVGIDVEHNAHGDLRVNLTSPAGTTVTLG